MSATTVSAHTTCDPQTSLTRSLLGYGVVVGPVYTAVSLAQALTREGFEPSRHQWSLLENGSLGWIQIVNFVLSGAMLVALGVGLRRALGAGRGARWAPRLTATFGLSLIAAGVFTADPALGFPVGTPEGAAAVSWHGIVHFSAAGVGFTAIAAACFVLAGRYAAEGRRGYARYSRATGAVFLGGFACVASGAGSAVANLFFTATVIAVWAWVSTISLDLYRRTGSQPA